MLSAATKPAPLPNGPQCYSCAARLGKLKGPALCHFRLQEVAVVAVTIAVNQLDPVLSEAFEDVDLR
jgi:hypothetical protein